MRSPQKNIHTVIYAVELAFEQQTLKQIDLHGCMLDEVEIQIDRFISAMSSACELGCAIVCGTGTGAMKKKVLELLRPYQQGVVIKIIDKGPVVLAVFER